jgi:hypothetical protein
VALVKVVVGETWLVISVVPGQLVKVHLMMPVKVQLLPVVVVEVPEVGEPDVSEDVSESDKWVDPRVPRIQRLLQSRQTFSLLNLLRDSILL